MFKFSIPSFLTCLLWLFISIEPAFSLTLKPGEVLKSTLKFRISGEAVLALWIEVENFSHSNPATLSVKLGKRKWFIPLVKGKGLREYALLLGPKQRGSEEVIYRVRAQTPIRIEGIALKMMDKEWLEYESIAHAPVIVTSYLDNDIPLLVYYKKNQLGGITILKYTVIFSNEDGGTPTFLLMAHYGRTTDIEWVYELEKNAQGKIVREVIQSKGHHVVPFTGEKIGQHPVLYVCTSNGMVCPRGEGRFWFFMVPAPRASGSLTREQMMDLHPWTYEVMCSELNREKKISPSPVFPNIAHPSRYLYIEYEIKRSHGAQYYFFVRQKGGRKKYTSHLRKSALLLRGDGVGRTAIWLPLHVRFQDLEEIGVRFISSRKRPRFVRIHKAFTLTKECQLGHQLLTKSVYQFCQKESCVFRLSENVL